MPLTRNTSNAYLELLAYDASGYMGSAFRGPFTIVNTTDVEQVDVPDHFALKFSGSNPARGAAHLELAIPKRGEVIGGCTTCAAR